MFALLLAVSAAQAASCCGGQSAAGLLLLDELKGLRVSLESVNQESTLTPYEISFDGALAVSDSLQGSLGANPVTAELRGSLAYEILPELEYSAWKPRAFARLGVTRIATGELTFAGGLRAMKAFGSWTVDLSPDLLMSPGYADSLSVTGSALGAAASLGASTRLSIWTPRAQLTYRYIGERTAQIAGLPDRLTDPIEDLRVGAGVDVAIGTGVALSVSAGLQLASSAPGPLERRFALGVRIAEGR